MASGDTLLWLFPGDAEPPDSNFPEPVGLAAATGRRPALAFDDTTKEIVQFLAGMLRNYGGGGLTITIWYAMAGANTTKTVQWEIRLERLQDGDALGAGGNDFAAANTVSETVPATADELEPATITFTDGADMDSIAVGDPFRLELARDPDGTDDAVGDAEWYALEVKET